MLYDADGDIDWQWFDKWGRVINNRRQILIDRLVLDGSTIDELSNRDLITEDEREDFLGRKIRDDNNQHISTVKSQDEREDSLDCRIQRENNKLFLEIISQKSRDDVRKIIEIFRNRKKTAAVNCLELLLGECFQCIGNNKLL